MKKVIETNVVAITELKKSSGNIFKNVVILLVTLLKKLFHNMRAEIPDSMVLYATDFHVIFTVSGL